MPMFAAGNNGMGGFCAAQRAAGVGPGAQEMREKSVLSYFSPHKRRSSPW